MKKIRVAIGGVGSCASPLIQRLEYDKEPNGGAFAGLSHARTDLGGGELDV